jgi:hypothetical protein
MSLSHYGDAIVAGQNLNGSSELQRSVYPSLLVFDILTNTSEHEDKKKSWRVLRKFEDSQVRT